MTDRSYYFILIEKMNDHQNDDDEIIGCLPLPKL